MVRQWNSPVAPNSGAPDRSAPEREKLLPDLHTPLPDINDLPLINGDYNQLSQLVTKLLLNSLRYTRLGQVKVSTASPNGRERVILAVEDTGIGILPEDLPHVFERFYRGNHRQPADIPGTGLGLAIVKEIIQIHQGDIHVESKVDIGTKFVVTLPIK